METVKKILKKIWFYFQIRFYLEFFFIMYFVFFCSEYSYKAFEFVV